MYPAYVSFKNPIFWEAEGEVLVREGQLKCGCKTLTTFKQIPLPEISLEQRIAIAINCSLTHPQSEEYRLWAKKWLSGEDRTEAAAAGHVARAFAAIGAYDGLVHRSASRCAAAAARAFASRAETAGAMSSADAVTYAYAINIANNISNFDLVEIIEKVMMNYA
jgi:hypothetical protein